MTPKPTVATRQKIYRIALYGLINSGKTCILAALRMSHLAHPEGLSCTWLGLPPWLGELDGPTADAFTRGQAWLDKATRALEDGAVPTPNPNDTDGLFRFLFQFTATAPSRAWCVEVPDYSGELIDPDMSDTDLAARLREHLLSVDGLLVLAEAPRPRQDLGESYAQLERLKRAFASLRGEKQDGPALDVPVALLVNKWDRRTRQDCFSPEGGQQEVEEFLAGQPEPPHRGLVNALRGSVTEGNFRVFPVSAFGRHAAPEDGRNEQTEEPDRPARVNPLGSFGLEDGFVWACRRRDEIDVSRLEGATSRRRWWKPWQLAEWKTQRDMSKQGGELTRRFPEGANNCAGLAPPPARHGGPPAARRWWRLLCWRSAGCLARRRTTAGSTVPSW